MEEINPRTKGHQSMTSSMRFRGIGRPNEMCLCGRGWSGDVADGVVLQPISLVGCVEPNVGVVKGIEFHKELPVLQA